MGKKFNLCRIFIITFIVCQSLTILSILIAGDSKSNIGYEFMCPVDSGRITSKFGNRIHPITKTEEHHNGIDIKALKGSPVYATAEGEIIFTGQKNNGGYGKSIRIKHENGYESLYAHLEEITVQEGQKVTKGEQIGTVGSSGLSVMAHLYFEIRKAGNQIDPIKLIDTSKLIF